MKGLTHRPKSHRHSNLWRIKHIKCNNNNHVHQEITIHEIQQSASPRALDACPRTGSATMRLVAIKQDAAEAGSLNLGFTTYNGEFMEWFNWQSWDLNLLLGEQKHHSGHAR